MTRRSLRRRMQTVGERTNKELFRKIQSLGSRAGKRLRMSVEGGGPEFIGMSGKGYCIDTPGGTIWMEEGVFMQFQRENTSVMGVHSRSVQGDMR